MIIKEYRAADSQGKSRIFLDIECDNCYNVYTRQKRWVSETHGCSPKCLHILKGSAILINCGHCGKLISKRLSERLEVNYCSRVCKEKATTLKGTKNYRNKALEYYGAICNNCGFDDLRALEVHHKDRNRANNEIDNLQVLCANCHSIEHMGKLYGTAS